jgi:Fur family zinc uptake transcriptional regulator
MKSCKNHKRCLEDLNQKVEQICLEHNLKFTDLRKEVFDIVSQNHGMIKAYDILSHMQETNQNTKPPTVYRALDFLIENNFIHKINSLNSYITCHHLIEGGACFFLICSKCNSIEELNDNRFSDLILSSSKNHKFLLKKSSLEIQGVCVSCANK